MKKLFLLSVLTIIIVSCREKSSAILDDDVEYINLPENVVKSSIMDFVENYRYITLDTGTDFEGAIASIAKIRVYRDKIYVIDNVFTNKMLIFDADGTFFKRVSNRGRGPKEYVELTTFELDYVKEELLIKDDSDKKLLIFDLNGNYKRTVNNQNIRGSGIAVSPNGNMVYGVEAAFSNLGKLNDFKLILCDDGNTTLEKYCEDKVNYRFGCLSHNFLNPRFDSILTFAPQLIGDIFRISDTGVKRIYSINHPDMLDRTDYENYDDPSLFNKSVSAKKMRFEGNHADSNDYLHLEYMHKSKSHHAFYNKKDKSVIICDDKLCGRKLTFDEHDNLWGMLSDADLLFDDSEGTIELKKAIETSGNPVIVCYKLK